MFSTARTAPKPRNAHACNATGVIGPCVLLLPSRHRVFSKRLWDSSESPLLGSHAMRRGAPGQWQTPAPYRPDQLVHNSNFTSNRVASNRTRTESCMVYGNQNEGRNLKKISFCFAFVNITPLLFDVRSFVRVLLSTSSSETEQNKMKRRITECWFDGDLKLVRTRWQGRLLEPRTRQEVAVAHEI